MFRIAFCKYFINRFLQTGRGTKPVLSGGSIVM